MVMITYYPNIGKFRILMKTDSDLVLINHELTRNVALFR